MVFTLSACGSGSTGTTATGTATTVATATATAAAGTSTTAATAATATTETTETTITAPATASWAHLVLAAFPESLDPGVDRSSQGAMVNWLIYTGLTTYAHGDGTAGQQLIAGLATALPQVSDDGLRYSFTLRSELRYSNGSPVRASDFAYTVERDIRLNWSGAKVYLTDLIAGAAGYAAGRTSTISGIAADDSSGQIVIRLTRRFGAFANVLALPALGLIPSSTPMTAQPTTPPPGAGPYVYADIVAGQSFDLIANPDWDGAKVPGVPTAKTDIAVDLDSIVASNGLSMLDSSSDLSDPTDLLPATLLREVRRLAPDQIQLQAPGAATDLIFFNTKRAPFSSQLAREAVITALSHAKFTALIGTSALQAGCFLLAPAVVGHPAGASCPYGDGDGNGQLARARTLVARSGMSGQAVTVYSPARYPLLQWMTYYTELLNQLGFKATLRQIADSDYLSTVGAAKVNDPQTGLLQYQASFPGPVDFYSQLLDSAALQGNNNLNLSQVTDPHLDTLIAQLARAPQSQLASVAAGWSALERYVASKAYYAVIGYPQATFFSSQNVSWKPAPISPIYGWDLATVTITGTSSGS